MVQSDPFVLLDQKDDYYENYNVIGIFSTFEKMMQYISENYSSWSSDPEHVQSYNENLIYIKSTYSKVNDNKNRYRILYYQGQIL